MATCAAEMDILSVLEKAEVGRGGATLLELHRGWVVFPGCDSLPPYSGAIYKESTPTSTQYLVLR